MIFPPSTELRASLSGCHAKIPDASPASIRFNISAKTGRPGFFAVCFSTRVSTTSMFFFSQFSQFSQLVSNTTNLPVFAVCWLAGVDEKLFGLIIFVCHIIWAVKIKLSLCFSPLAKEKNRLINFSNLCLPSANRTSVWAGRNCFWISKIRSKSSPKPSPASGGARQQSPKIRILKIGGAFWLKSELFLTKIRTANFDCRASRGRNETWRSGGQKGRLGEGIFARPCFPIPIFPPPPNFVPVKLARRLSYNIPTACLSLRFRFFIFFCFLFNRCFEFP